MKKPVDAFICGERTSFYVFSSEADYQLIRRIISAGQEVPEWLTKRMVHVENSHEHARRDRDLRVDGEGA